MLATKYTQFLLLTFVLIPLLGCEKQTESTRIPFTPVDFTINLDLQEYIPLLNNGGYVYENRGYRGIIIYREREGNYIALERACSYNPLEPCEIVEVDDSGLFLVDPCCGSTFDFYGNPTGDPATTGLVRYETFWMESSYQSETASNSFIANYQ